MIKVLLADDHAIVREGVKRLFELAADIQVAAEASNGNELMESMRISKVDLILLDMSMPGVSGANLISRLARQVNRIPVLVLSMYNEPQIARRALNAGASGYVTKDCEPETLLSAIRRVACGQRYIDPGLAGDMVFYADASKSDGGHHQLSDREYEILLMLARGTSVNDIAGQLIISNKTVSTHKVRLMKKMNFSNNADIVRYAVENNLTL